ncbi:rho GTPase-activating protein 39-like [Schistocerca gregaria]|uniref:rho GTPase-activating protein 39-like n=1 Tax=Schistocerca gregaria TaxID=7010 RepID=UPI00211EAE48|nr:rho GTPase-activating protein 39-like [Schistocerca gregaria]
MSSSKATTEEHLPSWHAILDPSTDFIFYACPETGACSWLPPKNCNIVQAQIEWWEMYDSKAQRPYYYNHLTKQTVWELPAGLKVHPIPVSSEDDRNLRQALELSVYSSSKRRDAEYKVSCPRAAAPTTVPESSYGEAGESEAAQGLAGVSQSNESAEQGVERAATPRVAGPYAHQLQGREAVKRASEDEEGRWPPASESASFESSVGSSASDSQRSGEVESVASAAESVSSLRLQYGGARDVGVGDKSGFLDISRLREDASKKRPIVPLPLLNKTGADVQVISCNKITPPPVPGASPSLSTRSLQSIKTGRYLVQKPDMMPEVVEARRLEDEMAALAAASPQRSCSNEAKRDRSQSFEKSLPLPRGNSRPPTARPPLPAAPKPAYVSGRQDSRSSMPSRPGALLASSRPLVRAETGTSDNLVIGSIKSNSYATLNLQSSSYLKPSGARSPTMGTSDFEHVSIPSPQGVAENGQPFPPRMKAQINCFQLEGFANEYFRCVKKGFLNRHVISMRDRLRWTSEPLKKPLMVLNKAMSKKGLALFANIQIYMKDRRANSSRKERFAALEQILETVLSNPELHDEAYCQLCKQVTLNPNPKSVRRGFKILCLIVQYVAPSKQLAPRILEFIQEKSKSQECPEHVAYLLRKLPEIEGRAKMRRLPKSEEILMSLRSPFNFPIFGSDLNEIMVYQAKQTIPENVDPSLPAVLTVLLDLFLRLDGLRTEGVFRISGSYDACNLLRLQIEAGDYSAQNISDPHIPASLLKLWFRELKNSVIPSDLYPACIEASRNENVGDILATVDLLPTLNSRVLKYLMVVLKQIADPENSKLNKMSAETLAIIFCPTLMRYNHSNVENVLIYQKWEQVYITTLIKNLT